jgi:hypothetical protein
MKKLSSAFEKADTSAAYPYGTITFIPAMAIVSDFSTAHEMARNL